MKIDLNYVLKAITVVYINEYSFIMLYNGNNNNKNKIPVVKTSLTHRWHTRNGFTVRGPTELQQKMLSPIPMQYIWYNIKCHIKGCWKFNTHI